MPAYAASGKHVLALCVCTFSVGVAAIVLGVRLRRRALT
jgi:hypothetical protein